MDPLVLLILLSVCMLIGSFIAGIIPMAIKLSETKSRLLALIGSGILVGTALAIIIPEGVDSIVTTALNFTVSQQNNATSHNSTKTSKNNSTFVPTIPNNSTDNSTIYYTTCRNPDEIPYWIIGPSLVTGFILMLLIDQFSFYLSRGKSNSLSVEPNRHEYMVANQNDDDELEVQETDLGAEEVIEARENNDNNDGDDEGDGGGGGLKMRGSSETSLIRQDTSRSQQRINLMSGDEHINIVEEGNNSTYHSTIHTNTADHDNYIRRRKPKVTPTLGLVIHAAADGIALGAAATTPHREVEVIIFLAIMLHKGPAAFSLVVFLMHMGLSHAIIRRHLLAFSLSAPLLSLFTYLCVSQSSKDMLRNTYGTGIAMLFSAGTFLYVATVHVLPELLQNKMLTKVELLCIVSGSILPIVLSLVL